MFVRGDSTSDAGELAPIEQMLSAITLQLATSHPSFQVYIENAASEYKNSRPKSLVTRLETLIPGPLSKDRENTSHGRLSKGPAALVLDALDEALKIMGGLLRSLERLLNARSENRIPDTTHPEQASCTLLLLLG